MENKSALKRTPLYENHLKLKARMVPFAGYEMPVQYTSLLDEAKAVRSNCGLFDVSHMGQFVLKGKNALEELEKLVSNDLRKLTTKGQAQYNLLCNEEGGVIDDLIIYFNSPEDLYICVNASNRAEDFAWMKSRLNSNLTFIDESDSTALLALQGPKSAELISKVSDPNVIKNLKYYRAESTFVYDFPCYLSRTGYTGEDGFELYLKSEHAPRVWENLLEQGFPFRATA
jgi:aminomethyltransferase